MSLPPSPRPLRSSAHSACTRPAACGVLCMALAWIAACGGEAPRGAPPELPGVAAGEDEWFWRDVLAAALPGEAPSRAADQAGELPSARSDAFARLRVDRDPAALTSLMAGLRDPVIGVACTAARDLGLLGQHAAIPRLIKGLGPHPVDYDVPIELRAAEAAALARLGNPAGVPLILDLLAEGTELEVDPAARQWSATTRMVFIQELALDGLLALAGTDFEFNPNAPIPQRTAALVRARAWWDEQRIALWAATSPLEDPGLVARARLLVAHMDAYQLRQIDGARHTLAHLGPGVLPFLREGLDAGNDYVRHHCLEVMERLTAFCDEKVRGRLAIVASGPLLDETGTNIAVQAARVCGAAGVADMLVLALDRRLEAEVQVAVVDALGQTGRAAALDALRPWSSARDPVATPPDLRAATECALLRLDPERSPDAFLDLLVSDDPNLVFPAVERLIALTGGDGGLDPMSPVATRQLLLDDIRRMLTRR